MKRKRDIRGEEEGGGRKRDFVRPMQLARRAIRAIRRAVAKRDANVMLEAEILK